MEDYDCPCGFKAKYKSKLIRHLASIRKCNYQKELELKRNKKIINNKSPENDASNELDDELNRLCSERLQKVEQNIRQVKNFINMFESSNEEERSRIITSNDNKKYIDLIMQYIPERQNGNLQIDASQELHNSNNTSNTNISNNDSYNTNITNNDNSDTTNHNNNITNNNNTTNNNTTNNNFTFVYPFGFENIYMLSDYEMVDILTSKNILIEAMNRIYSHVENKNFMKRNMKREQVTVIDSTLDIKVINDDTFKREIIKNTLDSLKRMFYHCKNKLKIEHQIMLWQNLRILDESIRDNLPCKNEEDMCVDIRKIMDTIMNIIAADNERPGSKEKFTDAKNSLYNQEYKQQFNEKLNFIVEKIKEFAVDYANRTITLEILKARVWTRDIDIDELLSINHPGNDIRVIDVERTPRFSFFREMEPKENNYLVENKINTTGNIDSVIKIREDVADNEYKVYNEKFKLPLKPLKTLERKLKSEPKYCARDKMQANKKAIMKNISNTNSLASS